MFDLILFRKEQHAETYRDHQQGELGDFEGHNLRGNGGADIGPHDDPDRLGHGHQTGSDEADHQHRGHRRRLDDRSDEGPGNCSHEAIGGQLGENHLHALAGYRLEGIGHLLHAEQENGQTAEQLHGHVAPLHFLIIGCG